MEADGDAPDAYTILAQKVFLDVSFCPKQVKGKTSIFIQPENFDVKSIQLNCRQLELSVTSVRVNGQLAEFHYGDLYRRLRLFMTTGIYQYHFPKARLERHRAGLEEELIVYVPQGAQLTPVDPTSVLSESIAQLGASDTIGAMLVEIEYEVRCFRDGIYFAGVGDGDDRYPHAYSRNSPYPGMASCLFPCKDDYSSRYPWEISIRCPRTLGDIVKRSNTATNVSPAGIDEARRTHSVAGSVDAGNDTVMGEANDGQLYFDEEESALEMSVVCSGDMTDDIVDPFDPTRKTVTFACTSAVLAQHIGFAIGPFEHVDLSDYRDSEDDDRLGSNAIRVHGFCLPGRANEVRNSALVLARALDKFGDKYLSYPFTSYKICFVDDLVDDVAHTASLSICSSRLLFPEDIWEHLEKTTRTLVHALASQWIGVNIIPKDPCDRWVIVGASYFMTDMYLRELFGKNDHRFRLKEMQDQVVKLDNKRASLYALGELLPLDPSEMELMKCKAPVVLAILHHRLVKQSGKNGVDRCLWKFLLNVRTGKVNNGAISTHSFFEISEKVGHQKLESFYKQWVYGSGVPHFTCIPSFNKKKLVVQLTIKQTQNDLGQRGEADVLKSSDFMREAKERSQGVSQDWNQPAFVGPMTIRIHEADGTPYEHIVDINSTVTKVEIPYNTKYKRLKRSRRQKERAAAAQGLDASGEVQEEVTLYMLGDVLGSAEEAAEWQLAEWSKEDEEKMEQESYEWLRVDADFEWICSKKIQDMPGYMFVAQLQQDKDIVAQVESIDFFKTRAGHPLISTFMIRTLMDQRYFHGVRKRAADVLVSNATPSIGMIGLTHLKKAFRELYCIPGSHMTRPNDFSNRADYIIQCAILEAISKIKYPNGRAPMEVKQFIMDTIHYNDNRENHFSDNHYVATLNRCLAQTLVTTKPEGNIFDSDEEEAQHLEFRQKVISHLSSLQRVDEWIPSFQNIHTETALDSALELMKKNVIFKKPSEFMPYVRLGNADNVRIKAWDCIIQLGMLKNTALLELFIRNIATDPSPFFRSGLLKLFGNALGQLALGELTEIEKPTQPTNGLLIEEGVTTDRGDMLARKGSIDGALAALKADLVNNESFRSALEDALRSDTTSLSDVTELLLVCSLIYEPKNELLVKLNLPQYWGVEHLGNAKLRFYKTGKVRTAPRPALAPPKAPKLLFKPPKLDDKPKRSPTLILKTKPSVPSQIPHNIAPNEREPEAKESVNVHETVTTSPKQQRATPLPGPLPRAPSPPAPIVASAPPVPPPAQKPVPKPVSKPVPRPGSKPVLKSIPKPVPKPIPQPRTEPRPFSPSSPAFPPTSLQRVNSIPGSNLSSQSPPPDKVIPKGFNQSRHGTPAPRSAHPSRSGTPIPGAASSSHPATPVPVPAPATRPVPKPTTVKVPRPHKVPKSRKSLIAVLRLPPEKLVQFPTSSGLTFKKGSAAPGVLRLTQKKSAKRGRSVDDDDSESDRPLKKKISAEAVNGGKRAVGPKPRADAAPGSRKSLTVKLKIGTENMRKFVDRNRLKSR